MPGPYISDLDRTTPIGTVSAGGGNEQLQDIKAAIQNTWPNVDDELVNTDEEINSWETRIVALEGDSGYAPPIGLIQMWSAIPTGDATPPTGWAECDGGIHNGIQVPEMRGYFLIGANPFVPLDSSAISTLNTDAVGNHNHNVSTNNHALTVNEMPAHNHDSFRQQLNDAGGDNQGWAPTGSGSSLDTSSTGGNAGHNHDVSESGAGGHSHLVGGLPNHYAILFICYVGVAP